MPNFVPGLQLADALYRDAVAPLLAKHFAGLRCAAALSGPGSEVLGFDTPRSALSTAVTAPDRKQREAALSEICMACAQRYTP